MCSDSTCDGYPDIDTPRHAVEPVTARLVEVFTIPTQLLEGASQIGDAIAVLPTLFHLLWTGVLVTVLATKHLYEKGSRESKREPSPKLTSRPIEFLREHSLTIFLVITGGGWVAAFAHSNPQAKWGQVIGNIVSEWTQILGLVLMTKRLVEAGSEESEKSG